MSYNVRWFLIEGRPRQCKISAIKPFHRKKEAKNPDYELSEGYIKSTSSILFQLTDINTDEKFIDKSDKIAYFESEDHCLDISIKRLKEQLANSEFTSDTEQIKDELNDCIIYRRLRNLREIMEFAI